MEFSSIHIQGTIISSEILGKIRDEDIRGQKEADFGFTRGNTIRTEIGVAWAAARAHYSAFRLRLDRLKEGDTGTSETRNSWLLPLLRELGYDAEKMNAFVLEESQKTYAISHNDPRIGGFPLHLMGWHDDLDKRRDTGGPRLSPHGLTQEFLNNSDHVYALVSNGRQLRLLRDATRLVRMSYLEFDLQKMMEEELYADFALLFRLLHATRMPRSADSVERSLIEHYHQESLASGSRIREKLSKAVEDSILTLANGFLRHSANESIRDELKAEVLDASDFYLHQLRLIYRFLFLIVTEERRLVYADAGDEKTQRLSKLYYAHYSIERLRRLAARRHFVDGNKTDLWEGLKTTFRLFEDGRTGEKLGILPLGSGLFDAHALGSLKELKLSNDSLLKVIRSLTLFENSHGQWTRVNYSDLDVEEFGSVYEGLLEYDPEIRTLDGLPHFLFRKGDKRSSSGSHYTPEELVKPLIKHSLDYLIEERLKAKDPEAALLSLKVADVACGSGHILLSAARRIGFELACLRETKANGGRDKVEQPSPRYVRQAVRDVIRHCIYGVDKNPLAVELCKVALWLEAHNPGEPLSFLDHRIKCGDAIVGLAHAEELEKGIASEAFKALPGDDKTIASAFRKRNEQELKTTNQLSTYEVDKVDNDLKDVQESFERFAALPEGSPEQIAKKEKAYRDLTTGKKWWRLKQLADLQVAQFFLPKTKENKDLLTTHEQYRMYLKQGTQIMDRGASLATSIEKRFFHWFLEYPEVFGEGGFDCILGNPPFLGGKKISSTFGDYYLNFIKFNYEPSNGGLDFVTYFFRRIFGIIKVKGFQSLISTNTICQGDSRVGGLQYILNNDGYINFAIKSIKWPGLAAVEVSLLTICKSKINLPIWLNNKPVDMINSYLENSENKLSAQILSSSQNIGFMGSNILGSGFILDFEESKRLIRSNPKNKNVIYAFLNADDINNSPTQSPSRSIINFSDWSLEYCKKEYPDCLNILKERVKPERDRVNRATYRDNWWHYAEKAISLYKAIKPLKQYLVVPFTTKYLSFTFKTGNIVISHAGGAIAFEDYKSFSLISNTFHEQWAWLQSSTMGGNTLRYTPSSALATFPFPQNLNLQQIQKLDSIGESYHEHRRQLMLSMQLGLTKTYNLFHSRGITATQVDESDKQVMSLRKHLENTPGTVTFEKAIEGIRKLRQLHVEMDEAVLEAYGWSNNPVPERSRRAGDSALSNGPSTSSGAGKDVSVTGIDLRHDFYDVDYLPENDRVRYTIHPEARKEVLKRLLALNHQIHEEEVKAGLWEKKGKAATATVEGQEETESADIGKRAKKTRKAEPAAPKRGRGRPKKGTGTGELEF